MSQMSANGPFVRELNVRLWPEAVSRKPRSYVSLQVLLLS